MAKAEFREFLTILYVEDIERSLRIYRDICGFRETYRFPADGQPEHVELRLGNSVLGFADRKGQETHHLPPPVPGAMSEISLETNDADAAFSALVAAGLKVLVEPTIRLRATGSDIFSTPMVTVFRSDRSEPKKKGPRRALSNF